MNKVLSKLLHPKKRIAGLDIGVSYVKIMEIEGDSLENAKLIHYAIEPIPPHLNILSENQGQVENIEALAEIVRRCWQKSGITTKNMALALASTTIISKKEMIPILDGEDEELNILLNQRMAPYLPTGLSVNEISLDYSIIGINEQNPTDHDIMIIMAKKEKIEERIAVVEAAGLIPVVLDVEQYAFQNMLRLMKGEEFNQKTYLLVDGSATTLRMIIFRNGQVIMTRDAAIGGATLTKDIIINNNDITFSEAERIKIERRGDETYEIIEKTFLNNYVSEFIHSFQYFVSSDSNPNIDEIILTGGVAGIPNIEDAFKNAIIENNETHIKTEPYVARPLHSTPKNEKISLNKFAQDEPGLFLVTSLALRHFLRQY